MKLGQAFKMAFRSLWGNKGRSVLTMLGIIIGIAAVMTIVALLDGANKKSMSYMEAMGPNRIRVDAQANNGLSIFEDLYDFCLQMDDLVVGVTMDYSMVEGVITYGVKNTSTMNNAPQAFYGSHQYSACNNFQIARGRDLSKIDVDKYNNVCVLGYKAALNLFDLTDPLGKEIQVKGIPFTVIGVYAQKDFTSPEGWMDNCIILPFTAARTLGQGGYMMSSYVVKAKNSTAGQEATNRLNGFLTGRLGDPMGDPSQVRGWFNVWNEDVGQQANDEWTKMLSMILGGIAGISLLVGGIGIMNIMLVTVTERTREIGIRRAIGAQRKSIVTQFLIESGVICAVGGAIGASLGTILTIVLSELIIGERVMPALSITLGAVLFAAVLGIVFGMYPAIKASGLQPVAALRAE